MDNNKNSVINAVSVLSNAFLTTVTKHLCLLNLNIYLVTKQSTNIGPTPS